MSDVCDLTNKHCVPCEGGVDSIDREAARQMLADIPGWELSDDGKMISRRFEFKGFLSTMSFINAMAWMVAGGLSYTLGAVFYAAKRLPYNHAVWHVFVLAGGICHFLAVVWYVLPVLPAVPVSG